jgi:endonuclease G
MKLAFRCSLFAAVCFLSQPVAAEICKFNQVSKAQLQEFDSKLPISESARIQSEKFHFPWGLPGHTNLLHQREFIISYDRNRRVPSWVGYKLTAQDLVKAPRKNSFRSDPRISDDESSSCEDYERNRQEKITLFDRGHLAPNADMLRTTQAQAYTFFLSNMAPQFSPFNQRLWSHFEGLVRNWVKSKKVLYVITGSVFDRDGDGQPDPIHLTQFMTPTGRVGIPTHFYKILLHEDADGKLEALSVLVPHEQTMPPNFDLHLKAHLVSMEQIEKTTGLNFLPDLSTGAQESIEKPVPTSLWAWQN